MIDLSTQYLGLNLRNPLVASAGPLSGNLDEIRKMEDAGISAIVLPSLFEEQLNVDSNELDRFLEETSHGDAEAASIFPDLPTFAMGPDAYLEHIAKAKEAVAIPVIASLNGVSKGGWVKYAEQMEQAGADGLELNIYFVAADPAKTAHDIENVYVDLIGAVRENVSIPLAVKIGPYFSSVANFAQRLDSTGVNALVLFNRFYQPDFDLENLVVTPSLVLSDSASLLLRLHWVALLFGRVKADLAITGGVHTAHGAIKAMMAGARVAMMTSALLRYGIKHAAGMLADMTQWLEEHHYESIKQMQGSMSAKNVPNPSAFERGNYMKVLSSYSLV